MEDWSRYVRSRLPSLDVPAERQVEIVEELAQQLEATYVGALAAGAGEGEARARAEAEVADWEALAHELVAIERPVASRLPYALRSEMGTPPLGSRRGGFMEGLWQDVRYAFRTLRRAPGFTAVAIVTLALGIGATTLVYSLVDGVLLRPLPFREAGRLVTSRELNSQGQKMSWAWFNFQDYRQQSKVLEEIGGWVRERINLTGLGRPAQLAGCRVTANVFHLLGVQPALGRFFAENEDQAGAEPVVVVSHSFWRQQLGGEAAAIGRRIRLDDQPTTVIGVLPASFVLDRPADFYRPVGGLMTKGSYRWWRGNHWGLTAIGRLRKGVGVEQAREEVRAVASQLATAYPETNEGASAELEPLRNDLVGNARPMLWILLGAVGTLLAIGCVNLASLQLARALAKRQEIAVRCAIGASRSRLARQSIVESLVISVAGGAAGVGLAFVGLRGVLALLPANFPRLNLIELDDRVIVVAALVSVSTALLFGLAPALPQVTRGMAQLLRGARVARRDASGAATRRLLVATEVAMAVVLLVGAGLMARTMSRLLAIDPGFRTDHVVTARFQLSGERAEDERIRSFLASAEERLLALPGIESVGFAESLPLEGSSWRSVFVIEGKPEPARALVPSADLLPISRGYFETLDIPIVAGRGFGVEDRPDGVKVAVISESFAHRLFADESPLGHRFKQGWTLAGDAPWIEIVGVARDVKTSGLGRESPVHAYLSLDQYPNSEVALVARTVGDPRSAGPMLEAELQSLDADLPVYALKPMTELVGQDVGVERLSLLLLGAFALLALLLAAIGVFGVTAYAVSQRTHEFGIRMALGADHRAVLRTAVSDSVRLALAGVAVGLAGAFALTGLMRSLLFEIEPRDPATLSSAAVMLLVVSGFACYLPARRATRVDPIRALRDE